MSARLESLQLSLAEGDDGHETGTEMLRLAFPRLHAAMEKFYQSAENFEAGLPEEELRRPARTGDPHSLVEGSDPVSLN